MCMPPSRGKPRTAAPTALEADRVVATAVKRDTSLAPRASLHVLKLPEGGACRGPNHTWNGAFKKGWNSLNSGSRQPHYQYKHSHSPLPALSLSPLAGYQYEPSHPPPIPPVPNLSSKAHRVRTKCRENARRVSNHGVRGGGGGEIGRAHV